MATRALLVLALQGVVPLAHAAAHGEVETELAEEESELAFGAQGQPSRRFPPSASLIARRVAQLSL